MKNNKGKQCQCNYLLDCEMRPIDGNIMVDIEKLKQIAHQPYPVKPILMVGLDGIPQVMFI